MDRSRLLITLLLAAVLVGCAAGPALPTAATRTTTAASSPLPEAIGAGMGGRLVSRQIGSPPAIDGQVDDAWATAGPLRIPLTWGVDGTEHALDMELRALHTDQAVYLLAQWPGEPPSGEEDTVSNRLTLHWRIPEPAAQSLDCSIVCHTAFTDGSGHFVYANAETIPQGGSGALPAAGKWDAGTWTLEWSRPFLNGNPFDLQFGDLDEAYSFRVKIFERVQDSPDPVSGRQLLVFQP